MRKQRFGEAEPLLLGAAAGLSGSDANPAHRKPIVGWLVELDGKWGKPEKAAEWR